jgi:hypothetical protein
MRRRLFEEETEPSHEDTKITKAHEEYLVQE